MEIKGTAVKTLPDFINDKYPDKYDAWLETLPESSQVFFTSSILSTKWYPLDKAVVVPMEKLSELLSIKVQKLAWDMGVYSSKSALKGVYKVFIRIASPNFIIKRAANILQTYYKPSEINLLEHYDKKVTFEFVNFLKSDHVIMHRVGGWSLNTFSSVGTKNVEVTLKDIVDGENFKTLMTITWE